MNKYKIINTFIIFLFVSNIALANKCDQMVGTYSVIPFTMPLGLAEATKLVLTSTPLGKPVFKVEIKNGKATHTGLVQGSYHEIELSEPTKSDEHILDRVFRGSVTKCSYQIQGADGLLFSMVDLSKVDQKTLKEIADYIPTGWGGAVLDIGGSRATKDPIIIRKGATLDAEALKKVQYFMTTSVHMIGVTSYIIMIPLQKDNEDYLSKKQINLKPEEWQEGMIVSAFIESHEPTTNIEDSYIQRKLLKINDDNTYLVQDYYTYFGTKFSDPITILDKESIYLPILFNDYLDGQLVLWNEEGKKIEERTYIKGTLNGASKKWDKENGDILVEEQTYIKGKLNGSSRKWDKDNGNLLVEEHYKEGKLHGLAKYWDEWDGKLKTEGNYIDGKKDGAWIDWLYNYVGDGPDIAYKEYEVHYTNGVQHGLSTSWFNPEQRRFEGNYVNGLQEGSFKNWYPEGSLRSETIFKNGKKNGLRTAWYKSGEKEEELIFIDDKQEGIAISWYRNGQVKEKATYENDLINGTKERWFADGKNESVEHYIHGKKEGIWTAWYNSEQKDEETPYQADKKHGISSKWYENGQLEEQANYVHGSREGDQITWHDNGAKKYIYTYKNDKYIDKKYFEEISIYPDAKTLSFFNNKGERLPDEYESHYKRVLLIKNSDNSCLIQDFYFNYGGSGRYTDPYTILNCNDADEWPPKSLNGRYTTFEPGNVRNIKKIGEAFFEKGVKIETKEKKDINQ